MGFRRPFRTLHLVDLENLTADPGCDASTALDALRRYLRVVEYARGDLVMLAAHPGLMKQIGWDIPVPCRSLTRRGADGSDAELLGTVTARLCRERVDRLVIGSGDHAFAPIATIARSTSEVWAVTRQPRQMAATLSAAVHSVRYLDHQPADPADLAGRFTLAA